MYRVNYSQKTWIMAGQAVDSFDTLLSFVCTGRNKTTCPINVSVSPVPVSISDLKLAIQDKFQIPKCLQSISIGSDKTVLPDSQLIKDLYIRPDDCFTVTYLDKADMKTIRLFNTHWLIPFLTKLTEIDEGKGDIAAFQSTDYTSLHRLHGALAYGKVLTPWSGLSTVEANRHFLIQEKIVDNILKLYSLLLKNPVREEVLSDLEIKCESLLWNFAETREARLYVAHRGGLALMIRSMESCLPAMKKAHGFKADYDMYGLFDHSVGCLSNYSEIEQCQLPIASNGKVMNMMSLFAITGSSLNIFTKVLIANCFFRLSHNTRTHQHLLEEKTLERILKFFSNSNGNMSYRTSMVISYALALTLSRLLSFSLELVPSHLLGELLKEIRKFTSSVKTDKMASSLEDFQCNWITLAPFMDIFFAPVFNRSNKLPPHELDPSQEREVCSVCMQTSVMSLTVEMSRPCHRQLAVKQGLLECLVCLPWVVEEKWRGEVCAVVKLLKEDKNSYLLPIPTLHSLAAVSLARINQFSIRDTFKFY